MADLLQILTKNIKDELKHKWYDRTVKNAKLYTQLSTGEGSDELLKQFVMRENDKMFEQRKLLTQQIHSSVVKTLSDINFKIPRSPGITKIYQYKNNDEKKEEELKQVLKGFNGTLSFTEYLNLRLFELNDTDPNAWIVIESDKTDGTKRLQPYPFEVSSKEAINYEFDNNILQWLLVDNEIIYRENNADKEGHKYTIYGMDGYAKFTQVGKDSVVILAGTEEGQIFEYNNLIFIKIKDNVYLVEQGNYNTGGVVPAFRAGFNRDKFTKGEIYQPSWNGAIPFLMKTVKTVSELDLTSALHSFPQKLGYYPICPVCKGEKIIYHEEIEADNDADKYVTCNRCKGTGHDIATSSQDTIILALPRDPEPNQLMDLNNLVTYVNSVPVELIKWQKEYIDDLIIKCKEVVFNSAVWNKEDITKTATGVNVSSESVYDSLFPLASKYVNTWKFGINVVSFLTTLNQDLEIITNVSKDLKLKTKSDYIFDLDQASKAGASAQILNNIEHEIMRIDFEDNPIMYHMWATKDFFFPFSGKDDAEVKSIIALLPLTDRSKVLWMYYGIIFNEIEMEYGKREFYMDMNRKEQNKIIQEKVDEKIAELNELSTPKLNITDANA